MPSIVGIWKLAHAAAREAGGAALPAPYAGKGIGRVIFTAEGRMMSVVCDGRPELPAGTPREYSSYCGNYTFDGSPGSMRHPIRAASAAIWCAAYVSKMAA
jgi:hypothetical protein